MKTVRELAEEIDDRLMDLAREKGQRAACEEALTIAEAAVFEAEERVLHARVALFEAYPELLGRGETLESVRARASGKAEPAPPQYETVEVDDPDVLPRGERLPTTDDAPADLEDLWTVHDA